MSVLDRLRPRFWDVQDVRMDAYRGALNFRRIWAISLLLTVGATILPLVFISAMDYHVTHESVVSEAFLRVTRLTSNTRRTVSFFLTARRQALDFIIHDNTYEELTHAERLATILANLRSSHGGFADLGVIDSDGYQRAYVGDFPLEGKHYQNQDWFRLAVERGVYISDVFLGFRNVPHLVVAVRKNTPDGDFFILRATVDIEMLRDLVSSQEILGQGEAFLINTEGVLQTSSHRFGPVFEQIPMPVPAYDEHTKAFEAEPPGFARMITGYAYIPESPFIIMIVLNMDQAVAPWKTTRYEILGIALASILVVLIFLLGVVTFLVDKLFTVDQRRLTALHSLEYSNKMATIGRMAAGVAHEINNPLAIINEKAGLLRDLFTFNPAYQEDERLLRQADVIQQSVARAATVTHRLLKFARHVDVKSETLNIHDLVEEVIGFLGKEAERQNITISLEADPDLPPIESDRGKLQQIFLNIINNAIEAMNEGGRLAVDIQRYGRKRVSVRLTDNGCGIPPHDLEHVFEPFFSTKTHRGGTGLGLSITYGLVKEIGGEIAVDSEVGKGTTFTITLPHTMN